MTPSSSSREQVDGEGKPKVLLARIAKRFGDVGERIKTEDQDGDLGDLIDYSKSSTGKIIFVRSRNPRDIIDIDKVIEDLNDFRKLLNTTVRTVLNCQRQNEGFSLFNGANDNGRMRVSASVPKTVRSIVNNLKVNEEVTVEKIKQKNEEFKINIIDYRLNADKAKRAASSAKATSKNPGLVGNTQEHLINLGGLLKQVQANIIELREYKSVIANWSNLVDTSPS